MFKMKLIFLLFINILFHNTATAQKITLVADPWCPYNCTLDSNFKGYLVEIAELAFSNHNINVDYVIMPWARAIKSVLEGKSDGIIGVGKKEAPQLIFPTQELGIATHIFYTKNDFNWQYSGVTSLHDITLGVIRGYSYGELDNLYISNPKINPNKVQTVGSVNGLKQNIKKLNRNRIDALIEDINVFDFFLQENIIPNNFHEAGVAYTENIYIAFSPVNPKAEIYAQLLSKELKKMRASGQLSKILKKYNIKDWR
jgi:polar amino acid transport system substrate-binding protein